ncbi:MAG: hypothetical protein ACOZIN_18405 [Myxococcota bacterium]
MSHVKSAKNRMGAKPTRVSSRAAAKSSKPRAKRKAKARPAPVLSQFSASAPPTSEATSTGMPLTQSATPSALWKGSSPTLPSRAELARLSPEKRAKTLAAAKRQKAEVEAKICDRVDHLWKRLRHRQLKFRAQIYKAFKENPQLSPEVKQKLEALLAKSDDVQKRLGVLKAKAAKIPKTGTPENKTQRDQLARELLAMRKELGDSIHAAEKLLADAGLKLDLLAGAEQQIAPGTAFEDSLSYLLDTWLSLTSLIYQLEVNLQAHLELNRKTQETLHEVYELDKKEHLHQQWLRELSRRAGLR